MTDYARSITVTADPDRVFAFLSDVENLPKYFEQMTSAHPAEGEAVQTTAEVEGQKVEGEAWFRVDDAVNSLSWGSEGDNNYSGELSVTPDAAGSVVEVKLRTEHGERDQIESSLQQTLDNVKRLVEA